MTKEIKETKENKVTKEIKEVKEKINWEKVVKEKYQYDTNLILIIDRFVKKNKIAYNKTFNDVLCFVDRIATRDNRYYIDFENILNDLMLGVILNNEE